MPAPVPVAPNRGEARPGRSTLYKVLVTPVIFISFLVSLAWVDLRYSIRRSHNHAEKPSRLPPWLHAIVYRASPYGNVKLAKPGRPAGPGGEDAPGGFYYHSKQRKLMRMEVDDAFQVRRSVVVVLVLVAAGVAWGVWRAGCLAWRVLLRA